MFAPWSMVERTISASGANSSAMERLKNSCVVDGPITEGLSVKGSFLNHS